MKRISSTEFYQKSKEGVYLVDVREHGEEPIVEELERHLIPLGEVPTRMNEIPRNQEVYMICRSGARSARAIEYLQTQGFSNLINVEGGTLGYIEESEK